VKKSVKLFTLCLLLGVNVLSFSSLTPTNASENEITLYIEIYRIKALDRIGSQWERLDWHYYVSVSDGGESYDVDSIENDCTSDKFINDVHNFSVTSRYIRFYIDLVDEDIHTRPNLADISSHSGGGIDNYEGFTRGTKFSAIYDVKNDMLLDADETSTDSGRYVTSGEFDGSKYTDENDAKLWFKIWDDYEIPQADAGPDRDCSSGDRVAFDGTGSSASNGTQITKYEWDLDGDGEYEVKGAHASRTFIAEGPYTVTLRVTDSLDETGVDACVVNVRDAPPEASFTYSPMEPTILDKIQFTDASTDPDGSITSWLWDLGDGRNSTEQNVNHTYADKGDYMVGLTVEDDSGNTEIHWSQIRVVNLPPVAGFSFSPGDPEMGDEILFRDESRDPERRVLRCEWDFDDGSTAMGSSFTHLYDLPGCYSVSLSVTDDEGGTDTMTRMVSVMKRHDLTLVVRDLLGLAVANAEITLLSDDKYVASGTTDEKGMVVLQAIPEGLYEVQAKSLGVTTSTFCPLTASLTESIRTTASVPTLGAAGGGILVLVLVGLYFTKMRKPGEGSKPKSGA
jgi:PKD repeat protein